MGGFASKTEGACCLARGPRAQPASAHRAPAAGQALPPGAGDTDVVRSGSRPTVRGPHDPAVGSPLTWLKTQRGDRRE